MALQSTADLHLLKGLLLVSYVFYLFFLFAILHLLIYVCTQFHNSSCCPQLSSHNTLFHCLGQFHSVWLFRGHNLDFLTVSFFMVTGFWPVAQPPNTEGQSTIFITPRAEWPSYTPGSGYPFRSPFTTCMGCSGTILFPSHHTGTLTLIYI